MISYLTPSIVSIVWSGSRYIMRTILIEHPATPVCSHVTRPHNGGVWGSLVDFYSTNCYKLNQYVVIALIMVGVLCLVAISFVELMRNRWDKKYYKHACKYNNLTSPPGDLRDNFLYDFVAYSTRDQKWIMAKLVDHVERKNNNKFCLHDRVIIPGGVHVKMFLKV